MASQDRIIDFLERQVRKNVIFFGMEEEVNEDTKEIFLSVIKNNFKLPDYDHHFEEVKRLGNG